jgi:hypothetical protein
MSTQFSMITFEQKFFGQNVFPQVSVSAWLAVGFTSSHSPRERRCGANLRNETFFNFSKKSAAAAVNCQTLNVRDTAENEQSSKQFHSEKQTKNRLKVSRTRTS